MGKSAGFCLSCGCALEIDDGVRRTVCPECGGEVIAARAKQALQTFLRTAENTYYRELFPRAVERRAEEGLANDDFDIVGNYLRKYRGGNTDVVIPVGVTEIDPHAFENDENVALDIERVTIPEGVTCLPENLFSRCKYLKTVILPLSLTTISDFTFLWCTSLEEIRLPDNVTAIGNFAFKGCTSLASITLPRKIIGIGKEAFSGCTALGRVEFITQSLIFGERAFAGCTALQEIRIPDGVTELGKAVFENCTALKTANIPPKVKRVQGLFRGCTALWAVEWNEALQEIGKNTFRDCTSLVYFSVCGRKNVPYAKAVEDTAEGKKIAVLPLPENLQRIGEKAFMGALQLEGVFEISETVQFVGENAFADCRVRVVICGAKQRTAKWDRGWKNGIYVLYQETESKKQSILQEMRQKQQQAESLRGMFVRKRREELEAEIASLQNRLEALLQEDAE